MSFSTLSRSWTPKQASGVLKQPWTEGALGPLLARRPWLDLLALLCVRVCPMQVVKMGVQYSLWGGSVVNLGTEKHRKKYFDDIDRFRLPGEPR